MSVCECECLCECVSVCACFSLATSVAAKTSVSLSRSTSVSLHFRLPASPSSALSPSPFRPLLYRYSLYFSIAPALLLLHLAPSLPFRPLLPSSIPFSLRCCLPLFLNTDVLFRHRATDEAVTVATHRHCRAAQMLIEKMCSDVTGCCVNCHPERDGVVCVCVCVGGGVCVCLWGEMREIR